MFACLVRQHGQHVLVAMTLRQRFHRRNVHFGVRRPDKRKNLSFENRPAVGERLKIVLERKIQARPRLGIIKDAATNLVLPVGRGLLVHLDVDHRHDRDATRAYPWNDTHRISLLFF
jgi:hypothetical protein